MKEKNVIEIEERIPKLKERRKQRTNRRMIFYVTVFFILMLMIIYFQSPLSKVQQVKVEGNGLVSEEWIIEQSQLLEDVSIWNIDEKEVNERITENEVMETVTISREWLNTVRLTVKEFERMAYIKDGDSYVPVLESGDIYVSENDDRVTPYDAPILHDFYDKEEARKTLVDQLAVTSKGIRQRISDIYLDPVENDPYRLTLFMNDGFVVSSTANDFAERISSYPSIVEQLDPNVEGIVHMRMNPYFESFDNEEEESFESEG